MGPSYDKETIMLGIRRGQGLLYLVVVIVEEMASRID